MPDEILSEPSVLNQLSEISTNVNPNQSQSKFSTKWIENILLEFETMSKERSRITTDSTKERQSSYFTEYDGKHIDLLLAKLSLKNEESTKEAAPLTKLQEYIGLQFIEMKLKVNSNVNCFNDKFCFISITKFLLRGVIHG